MTKKKKEKKTPENAHVGNTIVESCDHVLIRELRLYTYSTTGTHVSFQSV